MLYAVIEVKWMRLAALLTGEAKSQTDEKALSYLCQEGVFQTMWYVILGYAISRCIFGLSIVNEYFYRIVYLYHDSASDSPVLALEASNEFLEKAGRHFGYLRDGYSVEELAELQDFWSSPPNSLISDRANATLNKEARYHLDATILFFLARAAALPTQRFLNDLPLPFAHHVPVDATAHSAADMRLKGLEVGRRRHSLRSTKRNKRTLADLYDEEKDEEDKPGDREDKSGDRKPPGKDYRNNDPRNDGSQEENPGSGGDNSRGGGSGPGDDNLHGGGSGPGRGHEGFDSRDVGGYEGSESRDDGRDPVRDGAGGHSTHRAEAADIRTPKTRQEFLRGLQKLSTPGNMLDMKSSIIASLISNPREHLVILSYSLKLRLRIYCRYQLFCGSLLSRG